MRLILVLSLFLPAFCGAAEQMAKRGDVFGASGFYVWQRQWSASVEKSFDDEIGSGTYDFYVLAGELEYDGKWRSVNVPDRVWRVPLVTAVFRLSVRALDDPARVAAEVIDRAQTLAISRIQLDVDAPERQIVRYAELVERIRRGWPEIAGILWLGATFLPCHLDLKDMRRILSAIDEPVIQLHGINAPRHRSEKWALMDRRTVFRALKTARGLDRRFKMALPSYAYVLTFNEDGSFRRLYAEGLPDDFELPSGIGKEIASPDLGLLNEIFMSPLRLPAIWFRLPIRGTDRWCLDRETLAMLERGEKPCPSVEFTVRSGGRPGVVDLVVRYRHQIPLVGTFAVVDWGVKEGTGEFFPLNGCRVDDDTAYGRLPSRIRVVPFACGEPFSIGRAVTQCDLQKISVREPGEEK